MPPQGESQRAGRRRAAASSARLRELEAHFPLIKATKTSVGSMGKAKKSKVKRGLPYDRVEKSMEVDDGTRDVGAGSKPLSAHKLRVLERKRLQAQIAESKMQRRKVGGGNKKDIKRAKKELSKQIKEAQQARSSLQDFVKSHELPPAPVAAATGSFKFNLPARPVAMDADFIAP